LKKKKKYHEHFISPPVTTVHGRPKYEGFGGGPLVGGGPGARAPWAPLKSGPERMN